MSSGTAFDPYSQPFTLFQEDGTPFNVTIPEVDDFILYSLQICINYAAQLGASIVLLIMLALLTKPEKRTTPIFILNSTSLGFNIIRNVLQCLYFTGPFNETYTYFAEDFSRVPTSAYAISITATLFTFLLLISIEISLCLQVQVVCVTLREVYRQIIFAVSTAVALVAIGFRLALLVLNSQSTLSLTYLQPLDWLTSATNITTTISICWFCTVFVTKLGFALQQRRKLGIRRFGPMQILFVIGCQTLIIPVIFSILEYTTQIPSMDSNVLTLVSIFTPLSAMWAASSIGSDKPNSSPHARHRKFFSRSSSVGDYSDKKAFDGPVSPSYGASTQASISPLPSPAHDRFLQVGVDLERQGF
ncbi:hypothetical protein MMC17_006493 [Xylographa soralifera]|nr:hypothetical protein [Xylographa soralifera]